MSHFPCLQAGWILIYPPRGERHRVKIKGSDDKGGHEERWICNGFIAVVKNLKVSKKSALTHAVKKHVWKPSHRKWCPKEGERMNISSSSWTRWKRFLCDRMNEFWFKCNKDFVGQGLLYSSSVFGLFPFVRRVQLPNLCFLLTLPSVPAIWNSACVLKGTPEDTNWLSFCELGIRSMGMMHGPLSNGKRQECLVGNCAGAMSAYLTESLVRQTLLNHIGTSAISARRRRQWNRNTPGRDQTSYRLRGMPASFTLSSLSIIGSVWPNDMSKDCPMPPQIIDSCFLALELKEIRHFWHKKY